MKSKITTSDGTEVPNNMINDCCKTSHIFTKKKKNSSNSLTNPRQRAGKLTRLQLIMGTRVYFDVWIATKSMENFGYIFS